LNSKHNRRAGRSKGRFSIKEMDNLSQGYLKKVDRSDLKSDYDAWPSLALDAWSETFVPSLETRRFNKVIFAGMGGSSVTGELVTDLAREKLSEFSFESIKDYHLPRATSDRSLVIAMSASGATEETISVLSEAHNKGMTCISFGSGGPIESLSKEKWGFNFVKTKMLKVPRSSLPGIFYPVLKLLVTNKLIDVHESEIYESINALKTCRDEIANGNLKKEILNLARLWTAKNSQFPLLYSSNRTRAVGLRGRQSINENAKMHAFNGEIPELCHNDIVGWDYKASEAKISLSSRNVRYENASAALLLRLNEDDPQEIKMRFDIVQEVIQKAGGSTKDAPYLGKTYLSRIISMLYLLDYVSYYMAILRGIDPTMTPSILFLKQELSKRLDYLGKL
jgi:glucose/mannose-6-phosphate isomerase